MRIDVAEFVQKVLPWECELKIAGKWHKVKPLTVADIDQLRKLKSDGAAVSESQTAAKLEALFEEPVPKLAKLTLSELLVVSKAIDKYFAELSGPKKLAELDEALARQISPSST